VIKVVVTVVDLIQINVFLAQVLTILLLMVPTVFNNVHQIHFIMQHRVVNVVMSVQHALHNVAHVQEIQPIAQVVQDNSIYITIHVYQLVY